MVSFQDYHPSTESYWRAIILFGRNVASYKFALGKSLLGLADAGRTFITLDELALPYSRNISTHLREADKQGQRPTGPFLDAVRRYNNGAISEDDLRQVTTRYGFLNVLDAFHVVNRQPVPCRFYIDERGAKNGITLTDELLQLRESAQFENLPYEAEARWKLVETAWDLNISRNLLQVKSDREHQLYVVSSDRRRRTITSSRDALNVIKRVNASIAFVIFRL